MTLGSICRNGLLWQERWCVVMGGHLLHPQFTADESGVARAHSLQVGDVDLDEVAGCQLLKNSSSPIIAVLC